jgi:hypothetical protein
LLNVERNFSAPKYHGKNKLFLMKWCLLCPTIDQQASKNVQCSSLKQQSACRYVILISSQPVYSYWVLRTKTENINVIALIDLTNDWTYNLSHLRQACYTLYHWLTWLMIEPIICHTWDKHAIHYTTDWPD